MKKILLALLMLALLISSAVAEGLTSFTTIDISGGYDNTTEVTEEIFAPYDLTMVNVWATWCGYCVQEMPELAKLKDMLPENVNLISICDDAADEEELVTQILQGTGATNFATLVPNDEMYAQLLGQVYAFPTTFFMDSEGKGIAYMEGVPSMDNAAEAYLDIINDVLSKMGV